MKNYITTSNCNGNETRPIQAKSLRRTTGSLFAFLLMLMTLFSIQSHAQWTNIATLAPHNNDGSILLLSDGRAFCKSDGGGSMGYGSIWDILTPDTTGSYVNGTWTSSSPMISERYSYPADVLMNGNVYVAGGEYGTDGVQNGWHAETYNAITDTWTACLGVNSANVISDGNSVVLANGDVLQAIVDMPYPTKTVIYNHTTNTFGPGPATLGGQNESMWIKLPDSSILFVDEGAQTSERYIPSTNTWIADGNVPVSLYDPYGLEAGPALMLPDGRAFFIASQGYTAFYTPSGNTSPGTWATGPSLPNGYGMPDAPAAMMPNGKILLACSPSPTNNNHAPSPTYFYEFDYLTSTYTQVNAPTGGLSYNGISQQFDLMVLPNGQVLCCLNSDPTSHQYYVYDGGGTPVSAGKPIVSTVVATTCTEYIATGQNFNGISQGSAFGDENQNDTNYPIVKLVSSSGHVYYCRSHDWNSSDVWTGTREATTGFTLPSSIPSGTYSLYVIANGISSDPFTFTLSIPSLSSPLNPPAICSGTAFTYTPTSSTNGATFTWTRAVVTGISNPAITIPQTTNPNEVLINTTSSPITVIYAYTITAGGCTNTENVSVVVNPIPTAAFTANSTTSCIIPDSVTFTNTSIAGTTYMWYFGDGGTSNATSPMHLYLTGGSFTVKLVATNACGVDSITQANYIVINPPTAPTATSPVTIPCGDSTLLTATGSDTLKWYNQLVGGTLLAIGGSYQTPPLNAGTTYYVENDVPGASDYDTPTDSTIGAGGYFNNSTSRYLIFNVIAPTTLMSVQLYAQGAGPRTITMWNSAGAVLDSVTLNVPNGPSRANINFPLTIGTAYELGVTGTANLWRSTAGIVYPYNDPSGFVSITASNANGRYYYFYDWELGTASCVSSRTPVTVLIAGITPSFTYTQNGNTLTFTNTSTGATTYIWHFGDGNTSNLTNPVHTYLANGTYTVTLDAYNGACSDSTSQTITVVSTGINNADITNALSIYPNPTDGLFNISAIFNSTEQVQVIVTNTLGEEVYKSTPVTTSNKVFTLDLRNESKGIYFVQLKTKNGSVVKKLVLN
jgi:PKD repeat protein